MPSTIISSYSYDKASSVLSITFKSDITYEYLQFPVHIYEQFIAYVKKGCFLTSR